MSWCLRRLLKTLKGNSNISLLQTRLLSDKQVTENKVPGIPKQDLPSVSELLENELVLPLTSKKRTDPDDTSVLLFPGQGSQYVGMTDDLLDYPNVREMFNVASEILRFDLLNYCQNGPQDELDKTVHCQPAVMLTSLAGVEKIQATSPDVLENCVAAAGFSVGEYAALVFAGALAFEDAVRLVAIRSQAMQRCCQDTESKMITAIGDAHSRFKFACLEARDYCYTHLSMEDPICYVSAYLSTNCVTIAGHAAAVDFITENSRKFRIRRISPIPVSGAFHTHLMKPALNDVKSAIKRVSIESPVIGVYSNVTGKKYRNTTEVRNILPAQIIQPVKWEQIIHRLLSRPPEVNMPNIYEVGPGKQLGSLLKSCNGKAFKNYVNIARL